MIEKCLQIAMDQREGRHDQIRIRDPVESPLPVRALQDQHCQRRRKLCRFPLPVLHHTGRSHYQGRQPSVQSRLFLCQQMSQRLQRLPQSHVIGEDTVEPVAGQELHPVVAIELILPQVRFQLGRNRHSFDFFEVLKSDPEIAQLRRSLRLKNFFLRLQHRRIDLA